MPHAFVETSRAMLVGVVQRPVELSDDDRERGGETRGPGLDIDHGPGVVELVQVTGVIMVGDEIQRQLVLG